VEDWSSIIGDAYEGKSIIHANHMDMCRFSANDDPDYILVAGVIKRWVNDARKGKQRENAAGQDLPTPNSSIAARK
jgi:hypothetical protein